MSTPLFTGCATALVTPMKGGAVDYDAFVRLIDQQAAGGVTALVVCGTTGEAATLTAEEQEKLIRLAAEKSAGRMKIVAGIGSNDTAKALAAARRAEDAGADGVLMVTPYYNKTTQAGLIAHFTYVADRTRLPVILYNVPGRTGLSIAPETYAVLADHGNIAGVKESSGDIAAFARTAALCGDKLTFCSGNDADTVAMMALGAKGVISVASNIAPEAVSGLCDLCLAGDYPAAAAMNRRWMDLFTALFTEVNPIPIKAAMAMAGLMDGELRLPLVPMGEANRRALEGVLARHGLL